MQQGMGELPSYTCQFKEVLDTSSEVKGLSPIPSCSLYEQVQLGMRDLFLSPVAHAPLKKVLGTSN